MAYAKGKLLKVHIGNGASPEVWTLIGGARSDSFTLNRGIIDISNKDIDDWRQILDGAGVRQATISMSGIFADSAGEEALRQAAADGEVTNFKVTLSNGATWIGPFFISNITDQGAHDGAQEYSATLESAGEIVYTAAA